MEFTPFTITILLIAFWWSGFVLAGLGFGGAGLMYPIAFLVVDSVLFIVPIVGVHLLIFTSVTLLRGGYKKVDWRTTAKILAIIMPTKIAGVFGLLQLPDFWLLMSVYIIIILYSIGYIFNIRSPKPNPWLNIPTLLFGGYVAGLNLSGAPIIAAVALQYLRKEQARESMFVVWIIAVSIKLSTLIAFDVDMQWQHQLWLFPIALLGHIMGSKMHQRLQAMQNAEFYRWMGVALLCLSIIGMSRHFIAL